MQNKSQPRKIVSLPHLAEYIFQAHFFQLSRNFFVSSKVKFLHRFVFQLKAQKKIYFCAWESLDNGMCWKRWEIAWTIKRAAWIYKSVNIFTSPEVQKRRPFAPPHFGFTFISARNLARCVLNSNKLPDAPSELHLDTRKGTGGLN